MHGCSTAVPDRGSDGQGVAPSGTYWLAWIDFFREPALWRDIERGIGIQAGFLVVLPGAAWANFIAATW